MFGGPRKKIEISPWRKRRKSPKKKAAAKRPQWKKPAKQRIQPAEEILFRIEGKMSTFGGPRDTGMSTDEGLALFNPADLQDPKYSYLFLPTPPPGTTGLERRLNPDKYYFACRWNYNDTPREFLKRALARVENLQMVEQPMPGPLTSVRIFRRDAWRICLRD